MKKTKIKISYLISMLSVVIYLIVMGTFYIVTEKQSTSNTRESAINNMKIIAIERATIIENYITEVENSLNAYSKAGEVKDVLLNPTSEEKFIDAQNYTKDFGADVKNLEGLYVAEWDTHVLTHTNESAIGITMRKDEPLKALQDSLLNANGVYNTGIVISPASGNQVISMYKPIYYDNKPIGLVGSAIHTVGLKTVLDELPKNGMEHAKYYLINTNTGTYIFHENEEMVGQPVEDEEFLEEWKSVKNQENGFYETEDGDIYAFNNMTDRGWVFVLTDTADEIFASVNKTKIILKWLTVVAEILLTICTFIMISVAMKPLGNLEKVLLKIANCDIADDKSLEKYLDRKDEIGGIANATKTLQESFRNIISTIKNASNTLKDIASDLNTNVKFTNDTCNQISQAVENVASGAVSQAEETTNAANNISDMSEELGHIKSDINELHSIANSMDSAKDNALNTLVELQKVNGVMVEEVNSTSNQVNATNESVEQIKKAVEMIQDIADQTKLLSLNASIEAAHAGEHGRGFAVVAEEIGKLASQSAQSSDEIEEILKQLVKNYEIIIQNVKSTSDNMEVQNGKLVETQNVFTVLEKDINGTVERIAEINAMVEHLDVEIGKMVDMISNLSAISEENSASTEQTMASIEELNATISQVYEKAQNVDKSADDLMNEVNVFKTV